MLHASDGLVGMLFVLVFVVGSIMDQVKKKNRQTQQPESRPRPLPRPVSAPAQRSTTQEVSGKPRETAAAMVPEELWKILRGEAPAPVARQQTSKRPWDVVYIPPEETDDEELAAAEDVNVELNRTTREAVQREHAAAHVKLRERPAPARKPKGELERLTRNEIQRAFVLGEIFGPPRGLE